MASRGARVSSAPAANPITPFLRRYPPELIATALFALAWAVMRAATQSITIDEADSYLLWVDRPGQLWAQVSNNHILNSLLMRLSTSLFGLSEITVRLPALIGAALYVAAALYLTSLIASNRVLRWALFVCLAYNPFVFDFFVAARGYSMAAALLVWALTIPAAALTEKLEGAERPLLRACIASSLCAALSFAANFAFAFADGAVLLAVFVWIAYRLALIRRPAHLPLIGLYTRLLLALIVPGLLAAALLCGPVLYGYPKTQLFFGARSLHETLTSLVGPTLYELNPHLFGAWLYRALASRRHILLPSLGAVLLCQLVLLWRDRSALRSARPAWQLHLAAVAAGSACLALSLHWALFRMYGLLLPRDRTGMYLVVLTTIAIGAIAAVPTPSRAGRICHRALKCMLLLMAVYFLLCLRLTHFREWRYGSEANQAYSVVADYSRRLGISDVPAYWFYAGSLNFYRQASGNRSIGEFISVGARKAYPEGKRAYVLYYPEDRAFIEKNRLSIVFHGRLSDVVVALRPGPGVPDAPAGPLPISDPLFLARYRRALEEMEH